MSNVEVVDGFFVEDDFEWIVNFGQDYWGKNRFFPSNKIWPIERVCEGPSVHVIELDKNNELYDILIDLFATRGLEPVNDRSIQFQFWPKTSYLPWNYGHEDYTYFHTWININWGPDDGGIFLYQEDIEQDLFLKGVIPANNRAVFTEGEVFHHMTPIQSDESYCATLGAVLRKKS